MFLFHVVDEFYFLAEHGVVIDVSFTHGRLASRREFVDMLHVVELFTETGVTADGATWRRRRLPM